MSEWLQNGMKFREIKILYQNPTTQGILIEEFHSSLFLLFNYSPSLSSPFLNMWQISKDFQNFF